MVSCNNVGSASSAIFPVIFSVTVTSDLCLIRAGLPMKQYWQLMMQQLKLKHELPHALPGQGKAESSVD